MPAQSPLATVKEKYGSKDKLVAEVAGLIEPRDGESKTELQARLEHVANSTLLHLVEVGQKAKELGGRDKIVARIAELRGQAKDHHFADKLKTRSLGQLIDALESAERRAAGKTKRPPKKQRKKTS